MVKIHGNWCGPNWTGGKNIDAQTYDKRGYDWNAPCKTPLDCGCRSHDYAGRSGRMPRSADTALIKIAESRILPFMDLLKLQLEQQKLILTGQASSKRAKQITERLDESADAGLVATGISIARPFRRQ